MKKLLIGSALALAAFAASPVSAATHHSRTSAQQPYASAASAYASVNYGGQAVYSGGKYLGSDPDPAIRLDLLRQGDQTNVGGN